MPPYAPITDLKYDRYSMMINGKRLFVRSGAMHYFRLPSQDLWLDRLYKLKMGGYNTVDLYFNWGYHSEQPGQYDFTGIRDIKRLLQITQELGLYVIARPGPYINAEVSGGGFPMWLLAHKELPLRNRREGKFIWSDEYMGYVREWWEQIIPFITAAPNILMMQIENEYSTLEVEPDTLQALYKMARELGVTVPLSHNDLFIAGLYEDIVDLYAFDNYSVTQFETDWKKMSGTFSVLDHIEKNLRPFCQNRPLIAAELQAGWFGSWKGVCYADIVGSLGREHINISTKSVIGQGLTVFNHYKAIGGTNWNHLGSTETYTSYDFGAPISEAGINTIRLYEAKALNLLLESFDIAATDTVSDLSGLPFQVKDTAALYQVRKNSDPSSKTAWLFFRNLNETVLTTDVLVESCEPFSLKIQPHQMVILPYHAQLDCGLTLTFSNAEPLWQDKHRLMLKGTQDVQVVFQGLLPEDWYVENQAPGKIHFEALPAGYYKLTCTPLKPTEMALLFLKLNPDTEPFQIVILGQHAWDHLWKLPDSDRFLVGADACLPDGTVAVSKLHNTLQVIDKNGSLEKVSIDFSKGFPQLPNLDQWIVSGGAPEIDEQDSFVPIASSGLDFDANGLYEGSGWYHLDLGPTTPQSIAIDAQHIWAVFLNGSLIESDHYLSIVHGAEIDNLIEIPMPQELFKPDHNEILIFVDSLGHAKGFHDDQQIPQGLRRLFIDGQAIEDTPLFKQLRFSGGLAFEKNRQQANVEASPIVVMRTEFSLPDLTEWEMPLGVSLPGLSFERINLYLNGILIGRHWEACRCQETFYLPPGILNTQPGAINHLALVCMHFEKPLNLNQLSALSHTSPNPVLLVPYDILYKVPLNNLTG